MMLVNVRFLVKYLEGCMSENLVFLLKGTVRQPVIPVGFTRLGFGLIECAPRISKLKSTTIGAVIDMVAKRPVLILCERPDEPLL